MTRWADEITDADVPAAPELAAALSPPGAVSYLCQLAACVGLQWSTVATELEAAGQEAPEWVQAPMGALAAMVDELQELVVYLDAYVPSDNNNGKVHTGIVAVPGFCNARPPDGNGPGCLNQPSHVSIDGTDHDNSQTTWPDPPPPPKPVDPEWACTTCGSDASDMHAHEAEHGHWPTFGSL